jgi:hypothetical protein
LSILKIAVADLPDDVRMNDVLAASGDDRNVFFWLIDCASGCLQTWP